MQVGTAMMISISREDIQKFQEKILTFYKHHSRNLPWRQTTDPYKILISEVMLQQTQVSRVMEYYPQWILRWPTVSDLADAVFAEVLHAWIGLGYNKRAMYLHQSARKIRDEFQGDVLAAVKQYDLLPGIGFYTSQAVQIFAENADIATVDTNIRRILIHEFHLPENISERELRALAEKFDIECCWPEQDSFRQDLKDYCKHVST